MKNKHILNIGQKRSATTWLWQVLKQHKDFDQVGVEKENVIFFNEQPFTEYEEKYNSFNISANFHPDLSAIDTYLIKFLNQYATHITVMYRNPFELLNRTYNFLGYTDASELDTIIFDKKYTDYTEMVQRWKLADNAKFKILYLEDIEQDPKQFINDYFEFLEMEPQIPNDYAKVVNSCNRREVVTFTPAQIEYINDQIKTFEAYTNRTFNWSPIGLDKL